MGVGVAMADVVDALARASVAVSTKGPPGSGPLDDSSYRIDLGTLAAHPADARLIADAAAAHLRARDLAIEAVASTDTATLHLTSLLAHRLQLPMVYVRAQAKTHGLERELEGDLPTGARVLLFADPDAPPDVLLH